MNTTTAPLRTREDFDADGQSVVGEATGAAGSPGAQAPGADLPPQAFTLGRSVNRVRTALLDALDRDLAQYDISAAQLIVLSMVANGDAVSAAGLCRTISYDPGAMTRMVDRLEQKGLIRRVANPEDRRSMKLELTTAGRALYPTLAATKDGVQRRFLTGFSRDEVVQLDGFLQRLFANR